MQSFVGETPCNQIVIDFCHGTELMTKLTNRAYITICSQCCWRRLHQTLSNIQPGTACEAEGDRPAGRLAALLGLLDNCACKPARPLLSCAAASLLSRSCNELARHFQDYATLVHTVVCMQKFVGSTVRAGLSHPWRRTCAKLSCLHNSLTCAVKSETLRTSSRLQVHASNVRM